MLRHHSRCALYLVSHNLISKEVIMIIWRGFGILVLLLPVVGIIVASPAPQTQAPYIMAAVMAVGALGVFPLGRYLNRDCERAAGWQGFFDPSLGDGSTDLVGDTPYDCHSFFLLRMEYWALPLLVLAGLTAYFKPVV
jgi:hypothetical protein